MGDEERGDQKRRRLEEETPDVQRCKELMKSVAEQKREVSEGERWIWWDGYEGDDKSEEAVKAKAMKVEYQAMKKHFEKDRKALYGEVKALLSPLEPLRTEVVDISDGDDIKLEIRIVSLRFDLKTTEERSRMVTDVLRGAVEKDVVLKTFADTEEQLLEEKKEEWMRCRKREDDEKNKMLVDLVDMEENSEYFLADPTLFDRWSTEISSQLAKDDGESELRDFASVEEDWMRRTVERRRDEELKGEERRSSQLRRLREQAAIVQSQEQRRKMEYDKMMGLERLMDESELASLRYLTAVALNTVELALFEREEGEYRRLMRQASEEWNCSEYRVRREMEGLPPIDEPVPPINESKPALNPGDDGYVPPF